MPKITRSTKFEVMFPSLRKADKEKLRDRIWGAMDDATYAANKIMTTFWAIDQKVLTMPSESPRRGKNKGGPERFWGFKNTGYRMFNGEWQPSGGPTYTPRAQSGRLSGDTMNEIVHWIVTRFETDRRDTRFGKQSLPTFKRLPLGVTGQGVDLHENGAITLQVFGKDDPTGGTQITVRPVGRMDASRKKILKSIRDGVFKKGSAKLIWEQPKNRTGKWKVSLAYTVDSAQTATFDLKPVENTIVCGIDIGIRWTSMLAFTDALTGEYEPRYQSVQLPQCVRDAWEAVERDRKARSSFNRDVYDLRTGRGRQRKLRSTQHIGDKLSRLVDTAIDMHVATTIRSVKKQGATILCLEDHQHWSVGKAHDRADDEETNAGKAAARKRYFAWHQGLLRQKLEEVSLRENLIVKIVNPAMTSRTCPDCRKVWESTGIYAKKGAPPRLPAPPVYRLPPGRPHLSNAARATKWGDLSRWEFGRVTMERFVCDCGCDKQADFTAGIEIARRWDVPYVTEAECQKKKNKKDSTMDTDTDMMSV